MARIQGTAGSAPPARKVVRKAKAKPYTPPQTPDSRDNNQAARHPVVSHVSPDAQDVAGRSTQQKARDRTAVAQTVNTQRRAVLRRREAASPSLAGQATKFVARHFVPHTDAQTKAYLKAHPNAKPGDLPGEKAQASYPAPVLKVLEATTRPLHAIAAETKHDIQVGGLKGLLAVHAPGSRAASERRHALTQGIEGKDKTTFSDVLGAAGVKNKTLRGVGGFALDVGLDPTTYITGGTGSLAEKAAATAARDTEAKALAKGLTQTQAKAFGERAAKRVTKTGEGKGSGVTVKFAGQEIPGVRRATAAAARPVRKVVKVPQGVRTHTRAIAADVNPDVAPVGVSKAESQAAVQATRTARAKASHGVHIAQQQATGIARALSKDQYSQVIDAIEAGTLGALPDDLRAVAIKVRSQFRHANRLRKQAGIRGGERANYIPHQLTDETVQAEGKATSGIGRKVIRPASSKARKEQRSLAELRTAEPGRYSEDLPTLFANRIASGHESVARAELNRKIADMGTTIRKGHDVHLAENESVYHVLGSDIHKVDAKEVAHVLDHGGKNGRYVVLSDDVVKRALEGMAPKLEGPGIIHTLDKTTAGFKRLAIATPGFHVRNIVGDMNNAYIGQAAHRLPGNMTRAARVLKAYGRSEKALRDLTPEQVGKATLKTKRYGAVTYDEAARQLRDHGAFRSGYIARELPELAKSGKTGVGKIRAHMHLPEPVKRATLGREDLPRLTTAMQALREGATWEQAAQRVADLHFDYQHLTNFERQIARRVAPFYTWSARNIPLQAKSLVQKPGKFATYEKVREEAGKAAQPGQADPQTKALYQQLGKAGVNLPGGWEKYLSTYEARNAGIPISWKGHKFTVSAGQPLTDLNEFPGAAGAKQAGEYMDKAASLVTPLIKNPVELAFNYSFFFRDQIERDTSPLVTAPSYVAGFPAAAKKKLGVTKITDKRSGKKVWAWPGRVDYVAHTAPGIPNYAQQFATQGGDRQGKGLAGKALQFSGIRSVPVDPVRNAVNLAYARQAEIQKQLSALRQQGVGKNHPTPEWRKLNDQLRIVVQIAFQGKAAQGYKVLPTQGGPPRPRASAGKVTLGGSTAGAKVTLGGGSAGAKVTLNGG